MAHGCWTAARAVASLSEPRQRPLRPPLLPEAAGGRRASSCRLSQLLFVPRLVTHTFSPSLSRLFLLTSRSLSLSLSCATFIGLGRRKPSPNRAASRGPAPSLAECAHISLSLSLSLSVSLSLCLTQTPSLFLFLSLSQGETSEFASSLAVASPAFSATPAATPNKLP